MGYMKGLAVAAAIAAMPVAAHADDIFKGMRGPTNFQLDERVTYSENEKDVNTTANTVVMKYWDSDKWVFLNLPYKHLSSPAGQADGIGDVTLGIGPRGTYGNTNWFLYGSVTFPTGKRLLGNERTDTKTGALTTYLTDDKRFEADASIEYNFTGDGKPNEIYAGMIAGGKAAKNLRLASGLTGLYRTNDDSSLNWRSVLRYTFSPRLHCEVVYDKGIDSHDIPKSNTAGIFTRFNF